MYCELPLEFVSWLRKHKPCTLDQLAGYRTIQSGDWKEHSVGLYFKELPPVLRQEVTRLYGVWKKEAYHG